MFLGNLSLHFNFQASEFGNFISPFIRFIKYWRLASVLIASEKYPFHGEEGGGRSEIGVISKVHQLSFCLRLSVRFA